MVVRSDDRVLVDAAGAGDLDAFVVLVRRHQGSVYRVALRLVGSAADAEDVAQETFVQAWRSLGGFRGESALSTWLYRIVTNRALDLVAKRRPTAQFEDSEGEQDLDPATIVADNEQTARVMRAVGALPLEQRAALVLRDFEGLTYDQIGEVLGISLAAVKGRIHRGRLAVIVTTREGS